LTGTVTFTAGSSTALIDINPVNDTLVEPSETVILTLVNSSNYLVGTSNRATVTILDNDVLPTVTIAATDAEAAETNSGQTANPGRFTLTRTGSTSSALTVNYSIGGTATNGSDFNRLTGTVTFAAGSSTALIDINPVNDTLVEPSETVILTLVNSSNYLVGTSNRATVTILDNDVLPTVTIAATDAEAAETNPGQTPNPGRFTLTRTGSTTHALTVNYSIGGTATGGTGNNADYTIGGTSTSVNFINRTGTVTFAAGSSTAVIDINPSNDSEFEDPETVILTLVNSSNYLVGTSNRATVTIWDNDLPTVTIQATDATAAETNPGQTPNPGRFTLTRTGSTTNALTVNYSIGGTAIGGTGSNADYTIGGTSTSVNFTNRMGTVTFAAGSSTAVIDINPINDSEFEDPETVVLTLVNSSTYQIGTSNTATVTILDNDVLPGDWFSQNLRDEGLITTTRQLALDGILCRNDMISIFRNVQDGNVIDATELTDLRTILSNATRFNMPEYVRVLSNKVVNPDRANERFNVWQPSATDPNTLNLVAENVPLGNLDPGSSATHMERLIGKWFLGQDRPIIPHTNYTYRHVSGSLFQNGISAEDVKQGALNDCYYLATLAGIAHEQPSRIQSMFIDNGDNTFTVRFFNDGVADYVTVDRYLPTRSNGTAAYADWGGGINTSTSNELWVALAEKAYAQLGQSGWSRPGRNQNSYSAIEWGSMDYVIRQVTGLSAQTAHATNITQSQLVNWVNSNQIVTVGFVQGGYGVKNEHAYTITSYNPSTQKFGIAQLIDESL